MFAVQFDTPGDIDVLTVAEVPRPVPGGRDVIIEFEASTINPADIKIRSGQITPRGGGAPFTPGYDIVGRLVETGSEVTEFPVGSRVLGMSAMAVSGVGTWAQYVRLPAGSVAAAPDGIDAAVLAQLPLAGLTALQGIEVLNLEAGSTILVSGAAGAVGGVAAQLLRARGHRVHAIVRDEHQAQRVPAGVEIHVGAVPDLRVDAVLDAAGIDLSPALAPSGRHVTLVPGSAAVDAKLVITRESGAMLADLVRRLDGDLLLPGDPITYRLDEIRAAHEHYARKPGRRVALTP